MRLDWKMRVRFAGKILPHEHITQDIRFNNPGWGDEIFNRQIESLEFFLPTGHRIVMSGMQRYNFFIEATQDFLRRGAARIEAFWFLGHPPCSNTIEMWRVGDGKVVHQYRPNGTEWGGTATTGWKMGSANNPVSQIVKGH